MEKRKLEPQSDMEFAAVAVLLFVAGVVSFIVGYLLHGVIG